jgi:hypothetical protein
LTEAGYCFLAEYNLALLSAKAKVWCFSLEENTGLAVLFACWVAYIAADLVADDWAQLAEAAFAGQAQLAAELNAEVKVLLPGAEVQCFQPDASFPLGCDRQGW